MFSLQSTVRTPAGTGLAALVGALLVSAPVLAQGCICARQSQPILGGSLDPYLKPREWQISTVYRFNHSDRLFSGTDEAAGAPRVEREQHIIDLTGTYALNRQTNLSFTLPFADLGFGLGVPSGSPDNTHTSGIGDLSLVARRWLLDADSHKDGNISLGFGLKFPTGNYDARDSFTNGAGDRAVRFVDISTQPGDGGTGLIFDVQGFKRMKRATLYASGTYLANPRNTNGTPSLMAGLMGSGAPPNARVNSVPDQYVGRLGAAVPISGARGLALSFGGRVEGVPPDDLIGSSDGFRFAGFAWFAEPGLIYTRGNSTFALNVPVRLHGKIQNIDTTPGPDMGTLVPYSVIFSFSHRFGK